MDFDLFLILAVVFMAAADVVERAHQYKLPFFSNPFFNFKLMLNSQTTDVHVGNKF